MFSKHPVNTTKAKTDEIFAFTELVLPFQVRFAMTSFLLAEEPAKLIVIGFTQFQKSQ